MAGSRRSVTRSLPGDDVLYLELLHQAEKHLSHLDVTLGGYEEIATFLHLAGFETWRHKPITRLVIKRWLHDYGIPMVKDPRGNTRRRWTTQHQLLAWMMSRDQRTVPWALRKRKAHHPHGAAEGHEHRPRPLAD